MVKYIVTNSSITLVNINGETKTLTKESPQYQTVLSLILDGDTNGAWDASDIPSLVNKVTSGKMVIDLNQDKVYFDGEEVNEGLAAFVIRNANCSGAVETFAKFLEKLYQNPSSAAIQELFLFVKHNDIMLSPEGDLVAYKGVTSDYKDLHTRTFDNSPGSTNSIPRRNVDDDRRKACSYGLHVGSLKYANSFGPRTVRVSVNPADVVSVPYDYDDTKMRVCQYTVLNEVSKDEANTILDSESVW